MKTITTQNIMYHHFPPGISITVLVNPMLPIKEIKVACDVETRKEVEVETGKVIHCFKVNDDELWVSQVMYDAMVLLKNKDQ